MGMKHLAFAALLLAAAPAHAQQARVVAACGSLAPFGPISPGGQAYPTIDVNGQLCLSGGGGGGGSSTITAGTTPTSGFTAGQLMMSDGSLTQAAPATASGNSVVMIPSYGGGFGLAGFNSTAGVVGLGNGSSIGWSANGYASVSPDAAFFRPAAGTIGQWNVAAKASPETFRVYNTFTDASNGEWFGLDWQKNPNVLTMDLGANGTGIARGFQMLSGAAGVMDYSQTVAGGLGLVNVYPRANNNLAMGGKNNSWYQVVSNAFMTAGTQPTITGSGGTCAASTKVGGATAGTVVLSGVCASGNTIVFTGMASPAGIAGFACDAEDRTTLGAGPFIETASTTTGFTLTVGATTAAANDVLQWKCMGY